VGFTRHACSSICSTGMAAGVYMCVCAVKYCVLFRHWEPTGTAGKEQNRDKERETRKVAGGLSIPVLLRFLVS